MNILVQVIFFMVVLEVIEIYLHRAETLVSLVDRLYSYYRQSIFIFFLVHPSFYYVLGVLLYFDAFNFFGISILILKGFDLFFKIELIKQRYFKERMDSELEKMMDMKLTYSMKFLALFVHVPLLYMAITSVFG